MDNFTVAGNSRIKDGCVTERPCKDVLCLIIFLAFICAMLAATLVGLKYGQIGKFLAPLDNKDNFCGYSDGFKNQPNLYLTDLFGTPTQILKSGVCVERCPEKNGVQL